MISVLLMMTACSQPDDEQLIRDAVSMLRKAIEVHDRKTVLDALDPDFKAQRHQGVRDINQMMYLYFRQNKSISVFISDPEIRIDQARAEVSLGALLTGSGGMIPERGQRFAVTMLWYKNDNDWKLRRLKWEPRPLL